MAGKQKTLRDKQVKSTASRSQRHRACVRGLGLRRIGQIVELEDTPSIRGMVNKVSYLVKIEGE